MGSPGEGQGNRACRPNADRITMATYSGFPDMTGTTQRYANNVNSDIAFWMDYFGGIETIYLIGSILAVTQLAKMLLKAFWKLTPDNVRPIPYVAGSFLGLMFIDFTSRGAMIGVMCGMASSLGYYALTVYLEREAAPKWQKLIAQRLSLK